MINDLCKKAHTNAVNKGFWEEDKSFGEQVALYHSEASEAFEEYRDGRGMLEIYSVCKKCGAVVTVNRLKCCGQLMKPCGIPIELADTLIRIFDTCGRYGIDLEQAIEMKMKYNESRPYKHNKVI